MCSGNISAVPVRVLNVVTVFCVVCQLVSTAMMALKVKNGQDSVLLHLFMLMKNGLACVQQMGYIVQ